jgi:hypothetical protein
MKAINLISSFRLVLLLRLIEVNWEYKNITLLCLGWKYMSMLWKFKFSCGNWSHEPQYIATSVSTRHIQRDKSWIWWLADVILSYSHVILLVWPVRVHVMDLPARISVWNNCNVGFMLAPYTRANHFLGGWYVWAYGSSHQTHFCLYQSLAITSSCCPCFTAVTWRWSIMYYKLVFQYA